MELIILNRKNINDFNVLSKNINDYNIDLKLTNDLMRPDFFEKYDEVYCRF